MMLKDHSQKIDRETKKKEKERTLIEENWGWRR